MGDRRWWAALPAVLVALATATPAAGDGTVTAGEPDPSGPTVADVTVPEGPVDVGVVGAPLRFEAGPGVALELADGRRFLDTLEVRRPGDDQILVNDLTVDDYVAGVAEMPGRWHLEALKAQAVAARTYAWYSVQLGTFADRGYDICDTVACQAFAGASQQEGDHGDRWRTAVDRTAGEVLLDEAGEPLLARYFSTSGGRTLPNEVVFPGSGPRPYLTGTDDPADAVSPYHRWTVSFTRDQFDAILARGERLAAAVPVASVERLGDVHEPADVRVTGEDGTEVVVDSVELRRFVSDVAPELYPDRYPSRRSDGLRDLPTTLPSSRFTVEVTADEVVVSGRGWGHGVGMGQYGARGRAEDGASYDEILAAYYGGTRPTTSDRLPEHIRVGLSQASVGSITPDKPMRIVAEGEVVADAAAGTWALAAEDGGVRLTAPPGWGQPATATRTEPALGVPTVPRAIAVEATTAVPGSLELLVRDAAGGTVLQRPLGAAGAGRQLAVWDLTDEAGEAVAPGTYAVSVEVTAADGSTAGTPLPVTIAAGAATAATGAAPRLVVVALVALAVAVLALTALARSRAPRSRRGRPAAGRPTTSDPRSSR